MDEAEVRMIIRKERDEDFSFGGCIISIILMVFIWWAATFASSKARETYLDFKERLEKLEGKK